MPKGAISNGKLTGPDLLHDGCNAKGCMMLSLTCMLVEDAVMERAFRGVQPNAQMRLSKKE